MNTNKRVKVIKRADVAAAAPAKKSKKKAFGEQKRAAREMVNTVTSWVSDFQARKTEETKAAIKILLAETQPG